MANAFRMSALEAQQLGLIDEAPGLPTRLRAVFKLSDEDLLADQLRFFVARGLKCIRQLQFAKDEPGPHQGRRWAFDLAFPDQMVAAEVEGLIPVVLWRAKLEGSAPLERNGRITNVIAVTRTPAVLGRHASISGIKGDMEKYNAAAELGWLVLRFEQKDVKPGHARDTIMRVLASRGWRG